MTTPGFTLAELADFLNARLQGDASVKITGVNTLQDAQSGQISFLENPRYRHYLPDTKASAVILTEEDLLDCHTNALITSKPYVAYAKLAQKFVKKNLHRVGIHATAVVGEHAQIDPTASIGAHCVLGAHVKIGKNVLIEPGCVIGDHVSVAANSHLYPNVTIYHEVIIGENAIIHSGAVIGSDGFGFANENGNWIKIPQIGKVVIGKDVEIGANTTIDRGALQDTIIEDDVKLDNQIQIAHNVKIGAHTAIAGGTAIAGSTTIGKYCMIAGCVAIAGHVTIADKVVLTGMTGVSKSLTKAGTYSTGFPAEESLEWWKHVARFKQVGEIAKRLKKLEALLEEKLR